MVRAILRDAGRVTDLMFCLEVFASEDGRLTGDLTDAEIVSEARFLLEKYQPDHGWRHGADLLGENGEEARRAAKRTVGRLEWFISKYTKSRRE